MLSRISFLTAKVQKTKIQDWKHPEHSFNQTKVIALTNKLVAIKREKIFDIIVYDLENEKYLEPIPDSKDTAQHLHAISCGDKFAVITINKILIYTKDTYIKKTPDEISIKNQQLSNGGTGYSISQIKSSSDGIFLFLFVRVTTANTDHAEVILINLKTKEIEIIWTENAKENPLMSPKDIVLFSATRLGLVLPARFQFLLLLEKDKNVWVTKKLQSITKHSHFFEKVYAWQDTRSFVTTFSKSISRIDMSTTFTLWEIWEGGDFITELRSYTTLHKKYNAIDELMLIGDSRFIFGVADDRSYPHFFFSCWNALNSPQYEITETNGTQRVLFPDNRVGFFDSKMNWKICSSFSKTFNQKSQNEVTIELKPVLSSPPARPV